MRAMHLNLSLISLQIFVINENNMVVFILIIKSSKCLWIPSHSSGTHSILCKSKSQSPSISLLREKFRVQFSIQTIRTHKYPILYRLDHLPKPNIFRINTIKSGYKKSVKMVSPLAAMVGAVFIFKEKRGQWCLRFTNRTKQSLVTDVLASVRLQVGLLSPKYGSRFYWRTYQDKKELNLIEIFSIHFNSICLENKFPPNPDVVQAWTHSLRSVEIIYSILW